MVNGRARRWAVACASVMLLASGCRSGGPTVETGSSPGGGTVVKPAISPGSATVFAAASLTASFNELKAIFERDNPGTAILLNLGPSSGLAAQISEQGGADVFASADQANMDKVAGPGLIEGKPEVFAKNLLQIIVAPGNPKAIKGLADLARPGLKVVLAAGQVPVGRYAREALNKAGVTVKPVSEAVDVKGVVGPVVLGEADAGIVYVSDVKAAADKAAGVDIPPGQNVVAEYPIALLKTGSSNEVARAFIDLVRSDQGRAVLVKNGFLSP